MIDKPVVMVTASDDVRGPERTEVCKNIIKDKSTDINAVFRVSEIIISRQRETNRTEAVSKPELSPVYASFRQIDHALSRIFACVPEQMISFQPQIPVR